MRPKMSYSLAALACLFLVGIATAMWWREQQSMSSSSTLTLYGNVDIREVHLAFRAHERIAQMFVHEGDQVEPGQLLATVETDRLRHIVAQAEARVAAQRQVVARLEAGTRPEEIRKARADVQAARMEAIDAERTARRLERLAEKGLVPLQERDDARATANAAWARLHAAQATLALAIKGPRKEDLAEAKALLQAYQADLALARRNLADASLYAPARGIIRNRLLEPGDMAAPERPVYTLALIDPVWVRAYIPEPDLGKIRLGMTAFVQTDSFPEKQYKAWVGFISPTAQFTPRSVETPEIRTSLVYQVRVFVCNPHHELRLGMPATVTIPLDQPIDQLHTDAQTRCQSEP
ncbi:MAG: HlyD family efflux transporter periplasmic adaptor subunit [Nitrospirae bacterium]|nr:MAG: HlyD family efflux transporter periplasmic adaptor subunit [Nitrospirota bacterium]